MSQVVLFHHALGLTDGVRAPARTLSDAGHAVHTPDLFEGKVFGTIEEGVGYASEVGFGAVVARGVEAAAACRRTSSSRASPSACCRRSASRRPGPPTYDADATALLTTRVLDLLARVG